MEATQVDSKWQESILLANRKKKKKTGSLQLIIVPGKPL